MPTTFMDGIAVAVWLALTLLGWLASVTPQTGFAVPEPARR